MYEYKNQFELYKSLKPAFNVKLKQLKKAGYQNITEKDIWEYLKKTKWINSVDLTLADMVQDIIHTDNLEFKKYQKEV